jgi:hypothetical protein
MLAFQLDLFAGSEQIIVASGGAIHPVRRRMSGQLPRRRKRKSDEDQRQLELPFGEHGGALTPPAHPYYQSPAIKEEQHGE